MKSVSLHLVCVAGKDIEPKDCLRTPPLPKVSYFKKLISQMSATSVIMIPFHVRLFR